MSAIDPKQAEQEELVAEWLRATQVSLSATPIS